MITRVAGWPCRRSGSPGPLRQVITARRPPSGLSSSAMSPPCARAIEREIANPRPDPPSSLLRPASSRTHRSKTRSRSAGDNARPVVVHRNHDIAADRRDVHLNVSGVARCVRREVLEHPRQRRLVTRNENRRRRRDMQAGRCRRPRQASVACCRGARARASHRQGDERRWTSASTSRATAGHSAGAMSVESATSSWVCTDAIGDRSSCAASAMNCAAAHRRHAVAEASC